MTLLLTVVGVFAAICLTIACLMGQQILAIEVSGWMVVLSRRLVERAQALTGITTFEQLRVPLAVVATDLNAGKPAVFRSGDLTPALLASTAIPGLFPTVRIGDREASCE